jgi:hypothetical protein
MEKIDSIDKPNVMQHYLLTPPMSQDRSFPSRSMAEIEAANSLCMLSENRFGAVTQLTPPSTASSLQRPKRSMSPDKNQINHNGIAAFEKVDPVVTDLLEPGVSAHLPKPPNSGTRTRRKRPPRQTPYTRKTPGTKTTKSEKARTKEQRWGDYVKGLVGGEKDNYRTLPDLAVPPVGILIDKTAVRPYMFNKGKVHDYGDGKGLHIHEKELAREVGLSYDAYRQQKRMAFIGYAAMQLEGKKDFKKSHTQSMCNIDGNKATHLWVHFHDCWGWMPETPSPPLTIACLGDIQLPDFYPAK